MNEQCRLLYLVRHGATEANLRKPPVLQGRRIDMSLSEMGRRQAETASRALEGRSIHAVLTSPLRRASETAQIVARPHNITVQAIDQLTECDVGRWEQLSWEQVRQQDPQNFAAFDADPATVPYAGGESFQQVQDR